MEMASNHFVFGYLKTGSTEKYLMLDPATGNVYKGNLEMNILRRDPDPLTPLAYMRLAAEADAIETHPNSYVYFTGLDKPIKIVIKGIEFFEPAPLNQKLPF